MKTTFPNKKFTINKMKKEYKIYLILIIALAILLVNLSTIKAVGEVSFCCEKTTYGAYCMNEPEE